MSLLSSESISTHLIKFYPMKVLISKYVALPLSYFFKVPWKNVSLFFSLLSHHIYSPKLLLDIQFHLLKAPLIDHRTKYKIYLIECSRAFYRKKRMNYQKKKSLYIKSLWPIQLPDLQKCHRLTFLLSTKSKNHLEPTYSSLLTSSCNKISLLMHFSN